MNIHSFPQKEFKIAKKNPLALQSGHNNYHGCEISQHLCWVRFIKLKELYCFIAVWNQEY